MKKFKVFLTGSILIVGLSKVNAASVYDSQTNTITLDAGQHTLNSIYQEISNPAVLNYDSNSNIYTLSANISGSNGIDADLVLENATLVINSTSNPGCLIKTWSDLTINKMIIKAQNTSYLWKIWAYARYTSYSVSITDSDISGGIIVAAPNGYLQPSKPTVIKNNYFHDIDTSSEGCILALTLDSGANARLDNNTFRNIYIRTGQYNGILNFPGGTAGMKIDGLYISDCSVNSYGMLYFNGTTSNPPAEVTNFEIKDSTGDGISGKEWGNVKISSGTITNITGDGIHFYHSKGYGMTNWWVENVTISGAKRGISDNGADQLTVDIYNVKINNTNTAYRLTYGGPEYYYITNSAAINYAQKYSLWAEGTEIREYVLADIYVQDKNGNPVEGATISLGADNPPITDPIVNRRLQPITQTTTLSNGHTPLPEQDKTKTVVLMRYRKTISTEDSSFSYNITAEKYGVSLTVTVTPDESWYRPVPNVPTRTITLTLPFSQVGTVSGIVSGSKGEPIGGAVVTVNSPTVNTSAITAGDGRYTLTLPVGNYTLIAEKEGYRSQSKQIAIAENQEQELNFILFFAGLQEVSVYPNPYIKGRSQTEKITFANLPPTATIQIYSISGELLKTIEHRNGDDGGKAEWDVSIVSSGVYLYVISSPEGVKKGKVSVIK